MKKTLIFIFIFLSIIQFSFYGAANINVNNSQLHSKGFIENKGQIVDQNGKANPACKYLLNIDGFKVQLRQNGFSYEVIKTEMVPNEKLKNESTSFKHKKTKEPKEIPFYKIHRIDIDFIGASPNPTIELVEKSADYDNYYTAIAPAEGILYVHHYKKIIYKNIYPGIDVEFISNEKQAFKYNFIVHPHANINNIQLKINGAIENKITEQGNIFIKTAYGNIEETLPLSYELNTNKKVNAVFKQIKSDEYGIEVKNYNSNQTIIIDPLPNRQWGTYYGGTGDDTFWGCRLHQATNNIYASGNTRSTNAIATAGAHQIAFGGTGIHGFDAFVVMLNTNCVRQWATYYGGSFDDDSRTCDVVQSTGDVYIVGKTGSSNAISTAGSYQTTYGGGVNDAFLAKFNNAGVRIWSTYFGGNQWDQAFGCSADAAGNVYITGETSSLTGIATAGSHQSIHGGSIYDAFVAKFSPTGVRQWATYYGGSDSDVGEKCMISSAGNLFVAGHTSSNTSISTAGSHQAAFGGGIDGFLVKFNNNGVRQWATYYGGNGVDAAQSCAVDPAENVYLAGITFSTTAISTPGSFQPNYSAGMDGYFAKFDGNGTRQWATYFGAGLDQSLMELFLNPSGSGVYIAGATETMPTLPTANTHQGTYGGGYNDAFLAKFNAAGARQWATFYGGTGRDSGQSGAAANNGDVYMAGESETNSGTSIATANGHQPIFGGGSGAIQDGYIVKFSECNVSVVQSPIICSNNTYTLPNGSTTNVAGTYTHVINLSPGCDSTITTILSVKPDTTISQNANICNGGNYTLPGGAIVTNPGIYNDTLQTIAGCDSIIITTLTVGTAVNTNQNPIICSGASYTLPDGSIVSTAGIYTDTLLSISGCDSIITTTLIVNSNYTNTQNINICNGNSYVLPGGNTVSISGTYIDTLSSTSGCDSIITTILNYTTAIVITQNIDLCQGNTYTLPDGTITNLSGTYIDTISAANGCDSIITTILNINSLPNITISNDTSIYQGASATLIAAGGTNYNWSPESGLNTNIGNTIIATPASTTTYCVVVTNNHGCTSTKCVTVYVEEIPCPDLSNIEAPNAFSPNGDGINDEYCLQGWDICLTEFQIAIFDRWGEKVFESKDPNFCWDARLSDGQGKFRGSIMDAQVLVYHIKANYKHSNKAIVKKGNISLLR